MLFDRANQQTGKLDQVITNWWHANFSYLHYNSREPSGNLFQSISAPGATLLYRQVNATQVNNIITPNATTVISIRYGFNRYPNFTGTESDGFDPAKLDHLLNLLEHIFAAERVALFVPRHAIERTEGAKFLTHVRVVDVPIDDVADHVIRMPALANAVGADGQLEEICAVKKMDGLVGSDPRAVCG